MLRDDPALDPNVRDRTLRHSTWDGSAHALMFAMGEAYLVPFMIYLNGDAFWVGLLASGPLLVGSLSQLFVIHVLDTAPSRKAWCVWPAVLQALSLVPLLVLPKLFTSEAPLLLVGAALVYFVAGSIVVPPWSSWMGDLVEPHRRGDYFGLRNKLRTIYQVVGMLAAGLVLNAAKEHDREYSGFVLIFGLAALSRLVSAYHIEKMVEPRYTPPLVEEQFSFLDFLRRSPTANFGRFSIYSALFLATTNIAGPFFTPYMLAELEFSYVEFTLASCAFLLTQFITLHNWGRVGDRFGNRSILAICGFTIPIIPLFWLISGHVVFIVVIQAVAGVLWAGFTMAVANFTFDSVTPGKRARCVAYHNILTTLGLFLGGTGGGLLTHVLPTRFDAFGWLISFDSSLEVLFVISAVTRLIVSFSLLPLIREVRLVEPASSWRVVLIMVGLQHSRGVSARRVLGRPGGGERVGRDVVDREVVRGVVRLLPHELRARAVGDDATGEQHPDPLA